MSFKKIMAISGTPGLYKIIAQSQNGFIVESMIDGKRTAISSYQKISILEDVSIYGKTEDMPLRKVMKMMDAQSDMCMKMNPKADNKDLYAFLQSVFPDSDSERIYPSDIKKLIQWYQLLKDKVSFEDEKTETEAGQADDNTTTASETEVPKDKAESDTNS